MSNHEILGELGRGAMGTVHRARHVELGREVALKLIDPSICADEQARARFHREVKLLSALSHPHIVRIYDSGVLEGRPYFTMEILPGEDLGRVSAGRGPIPVDEVVAWMIAAADALAHLHERGHTHRDVKPSNLMLTVEGRLVVTDFGLVHVDGATVLTRTGELAGTPRYLAPEMLTGAAPSPAQDVWALALTAHELVTGRPWTDASTMRDLVMRITQGAAPAIETTRSDVPSWFADVQRQALARDPAARLTAARYRDGLKSRPARKGSGRQLKPASVRVSAPPAPERGRLAAAAFIVVALATGMFVVLAWKRPGPAPQPVAFTPGAEAAPPDRLRVQLAAPPPPGARLTCSGPAGPLDTIAADARTLELEHLPADTPLTLVLASASGEPLARLETRTPLRVFVESFRVLPSDTTALVVFRFDVDLPVVVELGTWFPRRAITTASATAGRLPFRRIFDGLSPDTDHYVSIWPQGRFGGVRKHRFRTWSTRQGESHRGVSRRLTADNLDESTLILNEAPEADAAAHVCRALGPIKNLEVLTGIRHVAWLARDTLSRCLVDRLLPALEQNILENSKGVIVSAAWEVGHPDALNLAEHMLPRFTESYAKESAASVLAHRGPEVFDTILAAYHKTPEHGAILQALALSDPQRTRALFAEWVERPTPRSDDIPIRHVIFSLARGRVPESARILSRVIERNPPDWLLRRTVDALVALGTKEAAAVLVRAHQNKPDHDALEWSVVRVGAREARPLLSARLAGPLPAGARRSAAFALGALIFATGAPDAAELATLHAAVAGADTEVASAAAWALGQIRDTGAAGALIARASGADPEGFAAWALGQLAAGSPAELGHAAELLLARLAREPADSSAALTRNLLVAHAAVALGTAAGDAPGTRARALAALGESPPPMLRQAVEGTPPARDVGPVSVTCDLFPQVPYLRLPFTLEAGESLDVRAEGWLALPGGQLKTAVAPQPIPATSGGDLLGAAIFFELQSPVLRSRFECSAFQADSGVVFSCYDVLEDPSRGVALPGAAGWVRVWARR